MAVETQFWRLRHPVALGDYLNGWRACWLGGWDRGRVFFIVMVERTSVRPKPSLESAISKKR